MSLVLASVSSRCKQYGGTSELNLELLRRRHDSKEWRRNSEGTKKKIKGDKGEKIKREKKSNGKKK